MFSTTYFLKRRRLDPRFLRCWVAYFYFCRRWGHSLFVVTSPLRSLPGMVEKRYLSVTCLQDRPMAATCLHFPTANIDPGAASDACGCELPPAAFFPRVFTLPVVFGQNAQNLTSQAAWVLHFDERVARRLGVEGGSSGGGWSWVQSILRKVRRRINMHLYSQSRKRSSIAPPPPSRY